MGFFLAFCKPARLAANLGQRSVANPYHKPAGSSEGGEFDSSPGGPSTHMKTGDPHTDRTLDTMSEAIAMSSPSGRTSQRARDAATKRLGEALFGPGGLQKAGPVQP